jgi:acyl carrier protein
MGSWQTFTIASGCDAFRRMRVERIMHRNQSLMRNAHPGSFSRTTLFMKNNDRLLQLLVEFFNLPADTRPEDITQEAIPTWDSLAMVQLITELQTVFSVEFELEEIETLRSHLEIRRALTGKGIDV